MTSSNLKHFLDFAASSSPEDLDKITLLLKLTREPRTPTGRAMESTKVVEVNLYEEDNAKVNHTTDYKVVYDQYPSCVLRRGSIFNVGIRFSQPIELDKTNITMTLSIGINPVEKNGTLVHLQIPKTIGNVIPANTLSEKWTVTSSLHHQDKLLLQGRSPVNTPVGRWTIGIMVGSEPMYILDKPLYIIFNPWLRDDVVYMEDDDQREFYTMKDSAAHFWGSSTIQYPKKWFLGQFERVILPAIEFLLRESRLSSAERSDHVLLVRALCAMMNIQDNNGVLYGKWTGDYTGGINPSAWSSVPTIINRYMESGGNSVKYGQCFVFAAAFNTVLRALGIPCRIITNFPSAIVRDRDMTVDYYYDENDRLLNGKDSEWNFHVWNECWMTRPDLPQGFDGWQVIDATPQIISDGKYQMGPFPVTAVLQDQVDLKYDGHFITAQVKALYKYYKRDPRAPGGFKLIGVDENRAGRVILTEKLNLEDDQNLPEDVTHTYKGKKPQARSQGVVYLKFEDSRSVLVGQPIRVSYTVTNTDAKPHDVALTVTASSVTYSNDEPVILETKSHKFRFAPGNEKRFEFEIRPETYVGKLHTEATVLLEALLTFSDHLYNTRELVTVQMPNMDLKVVKPEKGVGVLHYELTMKNPLGVALTQCEMSIDLPASTQFLEKTPVKDIPQDGTFHTKGVVMVTSPDTRSIVATFISKQLPFVTARKDF